MQPTFTANLASTAEYPTPAMPVMGVEFLEDPELRTTGIPSGTAHPVAWIEYSNPTFLGATAGPHLDETTSDTADGTSSVGRWDLREADSVIRGAGYRRVSDWKPIERGTRLMAYITPR
jgi:hypothetical protein